MEPVVCMLLLVFPVLPAIFMLCPFGFIQLLAYRAFAAY